MSFIFPGFLFALVAVAIPIIIHLFHFRRFRRVFFSNVSFLQQLSDESKKQSRIKHLLVLFARMMAIIFVVLAFARPYIPIAGSLVSPDGNAVAVYVDNSFSMDALSDQGRLLDEARDKARQIVESYNITDKFLLLTNDFEGRHQRFVSREEFLSFLDQVQISPAVKTTAEVINRQLALFGELVPDSKRAYLVGDFQQSTTQFDDLAVDSSFVVSFIPLLAQSGSNVFIDSCWFETPVKISGQTATMIVRISNDGDRALSGQPVRLFIDGVQRTVATYDLTPRGSVEVALTWTIHTPGIHHGHIEILDYPVTFDDKLYFSYHVSAQIPVLTINEGRTNPFLKALFANDSLFDFVDMPAFSVDFSVFPEYDVIILDGMNTISSGMSIELQAYIEQGGTIVVFPGVSIDFLSYRDFFAAFDADPYLSADTALTRVSDLDKLHRIFSGVFENLPENVDLPLVRKHYVTAQTQRSTGRPILQLQNGQAFFTAYEFSGGDMYVSAVSLTDAHSNFQRHAIFVPTLVNIAFQSQTSKHVYQVLGSGEPVIVRGQEMGSGQVFVIRGEDNEFIPGQRRAGNMWQILLHNQVERAGNYFLAFGDENVQGLSLNYDRRESALSTYSPSVLRNMLDDTGLSHVQVMDVSGADFQKSLQEFQMGRQLWRLFILLALACLLAEGLLLRFWK